MLIQKDLFAKALMIEKPWYIHEIQFDQKAGKLEIWIENPGSRYRKATRLYTRCDATVAENHDSSLG